MTKSCGRYLGDNMHCGRDRMRGSDWCPRCTSELSVGPKPDDDLSPTTPRTLTLAEVEAGADRAAARVEQWPEWKRALGRGRPIGQDLERAVAHFRPAPAPVVDQFGSAPRASIVAFLEREAARFDAAALTFDDRDAPAERCRVKAGFARTLAAQIARGDDRLGGGQ